MDTFYLAAAGFQAARRLEYLPPADPRHALHGHGFVVRVAAVPGTRRVAFAGAEPAAVQDALHDAVAGWQYRLLNESLRAPGDAALVRDLARRLDGPLESIAVCLRSAPDRGANWRADGSVEVWRRFTLHAAHRLPHVPPGHKCGRMHGHAFGITLQLGLDAASADAELAGEWLQQAWTPLAGVLDHACLNELPGLEIPTSEVLSAWIWERLRPALPGLARVIVHETASCGAVFDGAQHRIWKDFSLDSAVRLRHAPSGDARARLHGDTFALRLQLCAPLDQVLGWTVDFGDVKRVFDPVFRAIDHQPLHEVAGLADADCATLAAWVLCQAAQGLPALERVDLLGDDGSGALVSRRSAASRILLP